MQHGQRSMGLTGHLELLACLLNRRLDLREVHFGAKKASSTQECPRSKPGYP